LCEGRIAAVQLLLLAPAYPPSGSRPDMRECKNPESIFLQQTTEIFASRWLFTQGYELHRWPGHSSLRNCELSQPPRLTEPSGVLLDWGKWVRCFPFVFVRMSGAGADSHVGYNMALNLQSKLPSTDTLLVQDINHEATRRFLEETKSASGGASVRIADSVQEAAETTVSSQTRTPCPDTSAQTFYLCDEFVLSMI
jgi:hypothetical protein